MSKALANFANTGSGGTSFTTCGYPVDTNFQTFTQTGGARGAPNDVLLPASWQIDFVKVTQP